MKKLVLFTILSLLTYTSVFTGKDRAFAATREEFKSLEGAAREAYVFKAVIERKAPLWWYNFIRVEHEQTLKDGKSHKIIFFVSPDFLSLEDESAQGFFYTPVNFFTCKKIVQALNAFPLTAKMVDIIYQKSQFKIWAKTFPPGDSMMTSQVFLDHTDALREQLELRKLIHPEGREIVTGHKKDYVLTNRLFARPGREAIYGWHERSGRRIQPLSLFHTADWVDYSQGVRLVAPNVILDGRETTYLQVLADSLYSELLSEEGPIIVPSSFWNKK